MRYEIELLPHNGVAGRNPVSPFEGAVFPLNDEYPAGASEDIIRANPITNSFDGRVFTYSHTVNFPEQRNYVFRERVKGEPSEWAKARANA